MQQQEMKQPSGDWRAFSVAASGTFMATLDSGIVNTALPTVAQNFAASLPEVQWCVTGYFLVISCLLPLFGRMGDMYGRRRMYSLGFIAFTAASMICGAAPNLMALVGARLLQGVGAAMLMANGPAIIMAAFPGATRGRALGIIGMTVALGSLTGPGLGGLMIQAFGWRSVFYVNLPIGMAGLWLTRRFLPPLERLRDETLDLAGAALFAAAMIGLLLVMTHGRDWGWTSPEVFASALVALVAFPCFVLWEKRTNHPMIDLSLFRIWPFLSGNIVAFLAFMSMFSNAILLPFYLQGQLNLTPFMTGIVLSTLPLVMAVVSPLSGYLSERVNFATLTTVGLSILCVGLLGQSLFVPSTPLWRVFLGQVVIGLGVGIYMSPNNNSVLTSAPQDKIGLVGGFLALVRNVGMVSGIAAAITVFSVAQGRAQVAGLDTVEAFSTGFRAALTAGAAFSFLAGVLSFLRRPLFRVRPEPRHHVVQKDD
ncbi:MAG: MFS transporter [Humidesulfovibrio sp.]|uniref:MFS transporter n=1 Tax=Humidesulfovibrio sp. TaxID=2910988 RepID=UPI0027FFAFEC|nr:MFS transporter [Humidesulfovibrio sp.]MDQ7833901.1 MFS transporter [Humidesulfovibrio sp.]